MHTWLYAYQNARRGEWEMFARDHERFQLRIKKLSKVIDPIILTKCEEFKKINKYIFILISFIVILKYIYYM